MDVIYGDIYFVINFSMDFLALFICSKLRRIPFRTPRAVFAACIGAGYSAAELYMNGKIMPFLLSLALPFLMCCVCFGFEKPGHYFPSVLTFWIVSFLMGGAMTALYYAAGRLLGTKRIIINGVTETVYSDIPFWAVLVAAGGCAALTVVWNRLAGRRMRARTVTLEIAVGERRVRTEALCDSGDLLTEPIGGLSVILISGEIEEKLIPGGIAGAVYGGDPKRIRVIPYTAVSGSGILYGYIPDSIRVDGKERRGCIARGADTGAFGAIVPDQIM